MIVAFGCEREPLEKMFTHDGFFRIWHYSLPSNFDCFYYCWKQQGRLHTEALVKQCVVFFVCLIIFTEFVFNIYSSADKIVFINRMNIIKLTSIEVRWMLQLQTFAAVWFPTKL